MYENDRSLSKKRRLRKLIGYGVIVIVLLIAVAVTVNKVIFSKNSVSTDAETSQESTNTESEAVSGEFSSNWLFSGTVVTARAVENEARRSDGTTDWKQVFSEFDSFEPEKYDEWFIDMECPVTNNLIPYRTQVENTVFNCPPSVFTEMSNYFTVANIANNHTRDQGDDGFIETRKNVLEGGLQAVGHWDPRVVKDACEVMGLTFTISKDGQPAEQVELPIAVCAFHHFQKEPLESDFAVIEEYRDIMPVIGLMQVGAEYRATNDVRQEEVAHQLIDSGVDFVVGNSPHWVQNTEVYNDKLIVYSTGNFIFDQLDEETNRGLSLDVSVRGQLDDNILAWADLSTDCNPSEYKDDCIDIARAAGLEKIELGYSYDIVASTGGFRELTKKAPPAVQKAVETRANWDSTCKLLMACS